MKKFLVTYHAPIESLEQMSNATPEQQAKGMQEWMNWAQRCGSQLKDMGTPLFNGQALHTDGSATPSTKQVCGYSVVEAENMDDAKKLMDGHPHLNGWNKECSIEVHEAMAMPGM